MAKNDSKSVDKLTFEEAYAELERIVATMETGGDTLEASLDSFVRGQTLLKHCAALLDKAELKVKHLSGDLQDDPGEAS